MGKWPMVRLGDVCTINMGQSPSSESYNDVKDGIPFYQGNADFGEVHPEARLYCNKPVKIANKNDVLLSVRAPIGALNIANEKCCIGRGLCAITENENISYYKYIYYALKRKKEELIAKGTGSTFKAINKTSIESIKIPLPPLDVQKHIANILDKTQEIIDGHKKQLAELDDLIKAVFYEMFGDPVANEKGWEIKTLKDVCNKITDGTHHSPLNYEKGDYKYITAKNIKKDGFDLSQLTYVTKADHKEIYSRCNPQFGDILYIKDGVTTGIAQINTLHEEFSMLSSIALLKQKREIVNNYYLREVLNNDIMYAHVRRNMGGAAITRLTIKKIELIQIPLPPLTLQTKFANIVTKIEEEKTLVKQAITESEHLFNSLMSEYFD